MRARWHSITLWRTSKAGDDGEGEKGARRKEAEHGAVIKAASMQNALSNHDNIFTLIILLMLTPLPAC